MVESGLFTFFSRLAQANCIGRSDLNVVKLRSRSRSRSSEVQLRVRMVRVRLGEVIGEVKAWRRRNLVSFSPS